MISSSTTNSRRKATGSTYSTSRTIIIPPERTRYLAEIAETVRAWHAKTRSQMERAAAAQGIAQALRELGSPVPEGLVPFAEGAPEGSGGPAVDALRQRYDAVLAEIERVFERQLHRLSEQDLFDLDVQIEVLRKQLERGGIT